jgi:hypothetical protein
MDHTIQADIELFPNNPEKFQPNQERPSWIEPPISANYFPMPKKAATNNPAEARSLFNKIKHAHYKTSTRAYTDGSLNNSTERTKLAVTVPIMEIEEATTKTKETFVFTAEAYAINREIEIVYHREAQVEELTMFRTLDLRQVDRETRDSYRL